MSHTVWLIPFEPDRLNKNCDQSIFNEILNFHTFLVMSRVHRRPNNWRLLSGWLDRTVQTTKRPNFLSCLNRTENPNLYEHFANSPNMEHAEHFILSEQSGDRKVRALKILKISEHCEHLLVRFWWTLVMSHWSANQKRVIITVIFG